MAKGGKLHGWEVVRGIGLQSRSVESCTWSEGEGVSGEEGGVWEVVSEEEGCGGKE